jgi:prophage regulatory protein
MSEEPFADRVLRLPKVSEMVSLGTETIWRRVATGEFPRPVHLDGRQFGWRLSDVQRWIAELPELEARHPRSGK